MRILLVCFLALLPGTLAAQTAIVTSGEHAGFSRLVVTSPEAQDWQLQRDGESYVLTLESPDIRFDLSAAFERIPKSRVADLAVDSRPSTLRFTLACACHADAFSFRPNIVVVDIKSGLPEPDSPFEKAVSDPVPAVAQHGTQSKDTTPVTERSVPYDWLRDATSSTSPQAAPLPQQTNLRAEIAAEMARSADEGLIDLADPSPSAAQSPGQPDHLNRGPLPGLSISNAATLDKPPLSPAQCLDEQLVDVAAWHMNAPKSGEGLAPLHALLTTEAEEIDATRILTAARQYVSLGFGAEALQVLTLSQPPTAEMRAVAQMARILEGEHDDDGPFQNMETCPSDVALWAILSRSSLRRSERIASAQIFQAYSALPPPLRARVGPDLIERMLQQGDLATADRLRALLPVAPRGDGHLANARSELAHGPTPEAQMDLEAAAAEPGPAEAEALVALVELAVQTRTPVAPDRIRMLEALEAQYQSTAKAPLLRQALVSAYGLAGEFRVAASWLERQPDAAERFLHLLARSESDAALLEYAFTPPVPDTVPVSPEDRQLIADRLLTLGFPEQALLWLGGTAPSKDEREAWSLARGRALIATHRGTDALRAIAGLGAAADPLRAEANLLLGHSAEASPILARTAPDRLQHIQRTSRDWALVADQDEAEWSGAASLMIVPQNLPSQAPISLAGAESTLSRSEDSRKRLEALLQSTAAPGTEPQPPPPAAAP